MILGILIVPPPNGRQSIEEAYEWRKFIQYAHRQGDLVYLMRADWIDPARPEMDAWLPRFSKNQTTGFSSPDCWTRMRCKWPDVIWDRGRWQSGVRFQKYHQFRRSLLAGSARNYSSPLWMNGPFMNKNRFYRLAQEDHNCPFRIPDSIRIDQSADSDSGSAYGLNSGSAPFSAGSRQTGLTADHEKLISDFVSVHPSLYLKPVNGTGGRGILRIDRQKDGYLLRGLDGLRHPHTFRKRTHKDPFQMLYDWMRLKNNLIYQGKYVLQQTIRTDEDDGRVKDIRVLVQKDHQGKWRVTGMAMRRGGPGQICSNLHANGHAGVVPELLRPLLAETALRTAVWLDQVKGLHPQCEYGIDLAYGSDRIPYVLEVNPKPGRKLFRLTGDPQAERLSYERPLSYAHYLLTQKDR